VLGTDRRVELRTEPLRWACSSTLGSARHHSFISLSAPTSLSASMPAASCCSRRRCSVLSPMLGALALLVGLLETWTGKIEGDKTGGSY
jgi:hypothetical protein